MQYNSKAALPTTSHSHWRLHTDGSHQRKAIYTATEVKYHLNTTASLQEEDMEHISKKKKKEKMKENTNRGTKAMDRTTKYEISNHSSERASKSTEKYGYK